MSANNVERGQRYKSATAFGYVSLPELYLGIREDVLGVLQTFQEVLVYCIAVEVNHVSRDIVNHCHFYIKFKEKYRLLDLNLYLRNCWEGYHFDIQSCKSTKSALKYISKEDKDLIFNCRVSDLSFFYRSYYWARNKENFYFTDPFVVEHSNKYRYLSRFHAEVRSEVSYNFSGFTPQVFAPNCSWAMRVVCWWNKRIADRGYRRNQLYLFGDTKLGKTTLVERIIGRVNKPYIFYPGVGKFAFMDFKVGFHKVILFEEFDIKYQCVSFLKRLLEGRVFAAPVKCESSILIKFDGPVIFVSNFNNVDDDALLNRLCVIEANEAYYESPEVPVPKEEVCEEEVYEISSSPEGVQAEEENDC